MSRCPGIRRCSHTIFALTRTLTSTEEEDATDGKEGSLEAAGEEESKEGGEPLPRDSTLFAHDFCTHTLLCIHRGGGRQQRR